VNTAQPVKPPRAPGFWWALAGFGLGSLVSVGFNLQSAWLPAAEHGPNWSPSLASQAAAVVWPLTLIVSVEVLSRVTWPDGNGWKLVRFSGILAVALGSATISYGHIYEVLIAWGYDRHQAIVGPLVVDGLMLISGFALVALGRAARDALHVSQEAVAEPPAVPSRTPVVPRRPVPSGGEEPAVPVASIPPTPATGTAPQEASQLRPEEASQAAPEEARAALHLVQTRRVRKTSRKTSRTDVSNEDVFAEIASYAREHDGDLPTANWLKNKLTIGASRAKNLLTEYTNDKQEALA
jgi:hypothetical protein